MIVRGRILRRRTPALDRVRSGWRFVGLLLAVLALLGAAATARAQDEGSATDREARAIFSAGSVAFEDGRYQDALARFEEAYALSERPELLYNIGLCLDRLRRDAEALENFERFLAAVPETAHRVEVEHRIAALRMAVASVGIGTAGDADDGGAAANPSVDLRVPPTARTDSSGGDVTGEWWFWTLLGVGVTASVVIPVSVALSTGGTTSSEPYTGDFGPGGIVVALEVRP